MCAVVAVIATMNDQCIDLAAEYGRRYRTAYELPPELRTEVNGWPREALAVAGGQK